MTDEAKRCVETCREWYQAFANFGRGDERSVKDLLAVADLIESLSAELEQVKQERDAAVKDLEYAGSEDGEFCSICKYIPPEECEKRQLEHMHCWQWRGVREDDRK